MKQNVNRTDIENGEYYINFDNDGINVNYEAKKGGKLSYYDTLGNMKVVCEKVESYEDFLLYVVRDFQEIKIS